MKCPCCEKEITAAVIDRVKEEIAALDLIKDRTDEQQALLAGKLGLVALYEREVRANATAEAQP